MTNYQQMPPPPPAPAQPPSHRLRTGLKWTGVIVISWAFGACAGALAGGGTDTTTSSSATETVTVTETAPRHGPPKTGTPSPTQPNGSGGGDTGNALPQVDGDWSLDSIQVKSSLGDFSGTARVTYHGNDPAGGTNLFTVTVFKHGNVVGVLEGSANSVPAGDTTTVECISTDKFVSGPYRFDFANEL